ncbi:MAG TPA: DUF1415 family protein [Polyangiaceae bacterium]
MSDSAEVEREVLRVNARYLDEVVERFCLCPWAERARREGQVMQWVFQQDSPEIFDASLAALTRLDACRNAEVGLFLYPFLDLSRLDFEHFVRRLRALESARHEVGTEPFAMAAFHAQAEPNLDDPERLIPYLRRSPYPTIQVVRLSALERVRGAPEGTAYWDLQLLGAPGIPRTNQLSLRERIARANLKTVLEVGVETLEAAVADVLADRDRTRARLVRDKGE